MTSEHTQAAPSFAGMLPDPQRWPQPASNTAGTFETAYLRTWRAQNLVDARAAASLLLYAVGNNHSGSYFPVVLGIFPFLERVLRDGGEWARFAALDSLTDLCGSFGPEPGFGTVILESASEPVPVQAALWSRTLQLRPLIAPPAACKGELGMAAASLLDVLAVGPAEEPAA
ncbi:hypothetical protein [Tahibacter harae]|uniref:HEAT repeat domain-containing protein n=1 Tax=Tahibacter harae TaxID=2963937 RepID=A0ABT1QND1_9GAMM|nr:hypothetical protein [Tahibacter harae]MCQ4163927.1 hypothetical protein [Tahibacter harae]